MSVLFFKAAPVGIPHMSLLLGASIFSQPFLNFVLDPHNLICIWNLGGADIISLRCADEHHPQPERWRREISAGTRGPRPRRRRGRARLAASGGHAWQSAAGSRQHTRAEEVEVHCGGTTQPHAERTARHFFFAPGPSANYGVIV
jgi:hypothetical protein